MAIVVVAALVLPVVFPETMTAIATVIATKIRSLPTTSVTAMVVAISVGAALVALAAIWWLWWRLPRRNVSTTLIHPGSTFRLDSVTPAGGLLVDGELAGTEVFALRA